MSSRGRQRLEHLRFGVSGALLRKDFEFGAYVGNGDDSALGLGPPACVTRGKMRTLESETCSMLWAGKQRNSRTQASFERLLALFDIFKGALRMLKEWSRWCWKRRSSEIARVKMGTSVQSCVSSCMFRFRGRMPGRRTVSSCQGVEIMLCV